jgi:hypothetical protein
MDLLKFDVPVRLIESETEHAAALEQMAELRSARRI